MLEILLNQHAYPKPCKTVNAKQTRLAVISSLHASHLQLNAAPLTRRPTNEAIATLGIIPIYDCSAACKHSGKTAGRTTLLPVGTSPSSMACSRGVKIFHAALSSSLRTKCCWSPLGSEGEQGGGSRRQGNNKQQQQRNEIVASSMLCLKPFAHPIPTHEVLDAPLA